MPALACWVSHVVESDGRAGRMDIEGRKSAPGRSGMSMRESWVSFPAWSSSHYVSDRGLRER